MVISLLFLTLNILDTETYLYKVKRHRLEYEDESMINRKYLGQSKSSECGTLTL